MVPNTFGALIAFFLLVAPGILWESLKGRRQPLADRTAFKEVSLIVLASAVFTAVGTSIVFLIAANLRHAQFQELGRYLKYGSSASGVSPFLPGTFLLIEAAVALALVVMADALAGTKIYGETTLRAESVWVTLFRSKRRDSEVAIATVHLTTGEKLRGHVAYYSVDENVENRELGLAYPITLFPANGGDPCLVHSLFAVLPATSISYLDVTYLSVEALAQARSSVRETLGLSETANA